MSEKMKRIISGGAVGVFILLVIVSIYFYKRYKRTELLLNNPTLAAKEEAAKVTAQLSPLMELPQEEPVVVTVLDTAKLKGQQFFSHAKNGDKVIVYSKANKAILFRPTTNKIIEVAPVQMGTAQAPIKIGIFNSTTSIENNLTTKISNIAISNKGKSKDTFDKTLVIDVQGNKPEMAKQLADFIGGQVAELPKNESLTSGDKATTDLLVIVGNK